MTDASCHPATWNQTLNVPFATFEHSTDAHPGPWRPFGVRWPHIWRGESDLDVMRPRRQVPSGPASPDAFGQSWPQRGDNRRHPVQPPTQPPCPRMAHPHPVQARSHMPTLPDVSTSSWQTNSGHANPCMGDPVLQKAASPSNPRRHNRRRHARAEPVFCEPCKKWMRRQSLRRHVREVHDRIKRPHPKSRSAARPGP